jgi:hypothetical protein
MGEDVLAAQAPAHRPRSAFVKRPSSAREPLEPGSRDGVLRRFKANLPKGEGKLYSRFYRDPDIMDHIASVPTPR